MQLKRIAPIAVLMLAVVPAVADASTVKVVVEPPDQGPWAGIDYQAASGETNAVDIFEVNDTTVRVVDPGATITAGAGCAPNGPHTVLCTTAGFNNEGLIGANVVLGDMNDTVNSHEIGLSANGGPGNDHLESAGPVAGTLNGGGGRDVLLGGTNQDTLIDGDQTGATDSDVMDGRAGGAVVSYETHTGPVTVDLTTLAPAGEAGEGDVLRNITGATGGAGNDVLRGSKRLNWLTGGPGDDRLYGLERGDLLHGGPGNDRLSGGPGEDTAYGDDGDDRLFGSGGNDFLDGGRGADLLRAGRGHDILFSGNAQCGTGVDLVRPSGDVDLLRRDCEQALFSLPTRGDFDSAGIELTPYPVARSAGSLTLETECPIGDLDGERDVLPLRGSVTLAANGHVIGRAAIPKGRCKRGFIEGATPKVRIDVTLNRRGRRLLSDDEPTDVTIAYRGRNVPKHPYAITLR